MRILPAQTGIADAIELLKNGGIVLHPTETCYGIACDLSNHHAVEKVFLLKKRSFDQPISALFPDIEMAGLYVEWIDGALELAKKNLPGPFTLVLPLKKDAPKKLFPTPEEHNETIGVRISSDPIAHALVNGFESVLSTTSANLHGQPNLYDPAAIIAQFSDNTADDILLLDGGVLPERAPSTIMIHKKGVWSVVRQGEIT